MYFHTWELDPAQPKFTGAPVYARIRQYRNLERMPAIIGGYLARYRFGSIANHLKLELPLTAAPALVPTRAVPSRRAHDAQAAPRTEITIVVPCYNEAGTLPYLANTLRSVRQSLADRYNVRVILVDDGSHDGTWDMMTSRFAGERDIQCYRHAKNRGVAAAILTGIRHSTTSVVCSMDCDCSYDPHELGAMIPLLTDDVDVVTASPYHPGGAVKNVPAWRLVLSRAASRLYRMIFRQQLYTYTSCLRVYRRSAVTDIRVHRGGFIGVVELLGKMELAGARIVEYPTTLEGRLMGYSKMKVARTAIGHLTLMARLVGLRLRGGRRAARPVRASEPPGGRQVG
jgi:glycosyltransferase involved in cell wall biosynthesis